MDIPSQHQEKLIEQLRAKNAALAAALADKQAKIDALMLEYCPNEMTPEQMAEWEKNQQQAEHDEALLANIERGEV